MKIRKGSNAKKRLEERRDMYEKASTEAKKGMVRPGSLNPNKGCGSAKHR